MRAGTRNNGWPGCFLVWWGALSKNLAQSGPLGPHALGSGMARKDFTGNTKPSAQPQRSCGLWLRGAVYDWDWVWAVLPRPAFVEGCECGAAALHCVGTDPFPSPTGGKGGGKEKRGVGVTMGARGGVWGVINVVPTIAHPDHGEPHCPI